MFGEKRGGTIVITRRTIEMNNKTSQATIRASREAIPTLRAGFVKKRKERKRGS
jgi:hypothetical protein